VSSTSQGEYFIRATAARDIAAGVENGLTLEAAVDAVIGTRLRALGGSGGAIAVDANGAVACAFSSELMHRGVVTHVTPATIGIYQGEAP
jgi:beta-aspartyl-peptidase (threonine type)